MGAPGRAGWRPGRGEPPDVAPGEKALAVGGLVALGLALAAVGSCLGPAGQAVGLYGLALSLVAAGMLARALS